MTETQSQIFIIEDDPDIRDLLHLQLLSFGFTPHLFSNAEDAFNALASTDCDLALVDRMLPGMNGIEFCQKLRSNGKLMDLPIIFITALTSAEDIIMGLEAGADDYIAKPFDYDVLNARIKSVLRRKIKNQTTYKIGELEIIPANRMALLKNNSLSLTQIEFDLLLTLVEGGGTVLTRQKLINKVIGENIHVSSRTIDTHIVSLRKKIGPYAKNIETSRGIGYRFYVS